MSQFDLPRLHFHGKLSFDAATANNVNNAPLTFYDPLTSELILPPRIYLKDLPSDVQKKLPAGATIFHPGEANAYFCIEPIKSKSTFSKWIITPLGQSDLDTAYHAVYNLIPAKRSPEGGTLSGKIPGYWNYYGLMQADFQEVRVCSLAVLKKGKEVLYTKDSPDLPAEFAPFLEAELSVRKDPSDPKSFTSAVMVDVTPSTSTASQVFCDSMFLQSKYGTVFFHAAPSIAILRGLNFTRVVNVNMPQSASGEFFSVISVEELEKKNPIIQFFQKWGQSNRRLKGIFIRYNLFEVFENRQINYLKNGKKSSPALMTLAGSLSPWYEGDLETIGIGRQLQSIHPFYENKYLAPLIGQVDEHRNVITFDVLNNIPETQQEDGQYEALDWGTLEFCLTSAQGDEYTLGSIQTGPNGFTRQQNLLTSGIISFPLNLSKEVLREGKLHLSQQQKGKKAVRVMEETDFVIYSDQAGLYANQGDDPVRGYLCRSNHKEHCHLRIWEKGKPAQKPVLITIVEFKVDLDGTEIQPSILRHEEYADGDIISFPTDGPKNSIFLLLPGQTSIIPAGGLSSIFLTGSIIHLRVLARQDYGPYLDPHHPEFPKKVTWEVLYDLVFRMYDLIYPQMGRWIPFTKKIYNNPKMARKLVNGTDISRWNSSSQYMPATRDLSDMQKELIRKWAEGFGVSAKDIPPPSPVFTQVVDIHQHR